jgi:hypothetical protein
VGRRLSPISVRPGPGAMPGKPSYPPGLWRVRLSPRAFPNHSIAGPPSPDTLGASSTRDRMLQPFARSVISAVVAACFALGAITWGAMPECPVPGSSSQHLAVHGHGSHSHAHGAELRGVPHCPHLCCANLATPVIVGGVAGRLFSEFRSPGLIALTTTPAVRPPHSLPFAHGPPHPTA